MSRNRNRGGDSGGNYGGSGRNGGWRQLGEAVVSLVITAFLMSLVSQEFSSYLYGFWYDFSVMIGRDMPLFSKTPFDSARLEIISCGVGFVGRGVGDWLTDAFKS